MNSKTTTTKPVNIKPKTQPTRAKRTVLIKKAVTRAVQEYGQTLEKLAKND